MNVKMAKDYIIENINVLCVLYGRKHSEMPSALNVSRQHYNLLRIGKSPIQLEHLKKISRIFGVDLETLVHTDLTSKIKEHVKKDLGYDPQKKSSLKNNSSD